MHVEAVQAFETGVVLRAENPLLGKDRTKKALKNEHMTLEGAGSVFDRGQVQTSNRRKNAGGKGSQTGGGGDFARSPTQRWGRPRRQGKRKAGPGGFHETIERADLSGARNCLMQPFQARTMPMDRAMTSTWWPRPRFRPTEKNCKAGKKQGMEKKPVVHHLVFSGAAPGASPYAAAYKELCERCHVQSCGAWLGPPSGRWSASAWPWGTLGANFRPLSGV